MTKVEAVKKVLEDNNGSASWKTIEMEIRKYYPDIEKSPNWKAGIRGVVYREMRQNNLFKTIGLGIIALIDFKEISEKEIKKDKVKMHSYIEGICIELGNLEKYNTFTADPSALFNTTKLNNLTTLDRVPEFTYEEILNSAKKIDVIWFNKAKYMFPKKAYEIVDSIGTMENAFSRTFQISDFDTQFFIIGKKQFENKFNKIKQQKPYNALDERRYTFKNYDEIIDFYKMRLAVEKSKFY